MASRGVLEGKLAIVTGAAKQNGIGFAIALMFAQNGADIVLHYNKNEKAALESVAQLRATGVQAVAVQGDATSLTFGEAVVKETLLAFPDRKIDIVVNNAGDARILESFGKESLENFDAMFQANVRGPLSLLQAALPHVPSPGGRIINIGSVGARICPPGTNIYCGTKGALNTMSLGWSRELGPRGITVNTVAPGPIETDYAAPEDHPAATLARFNQHIKRNGSCEEVASLVLYVASSASSFITGQVLIVDGGWTTL